MKRTVFNVLGIFLAILMQMGMAACASQNSNVGYAGTWELDHVVIDGSTFTLSELKAMGEDYSMRMVLKDGGKAYVTDGFDGEVVDWTETDTGVQIDDEILKMENGFLSGEMYGDICCFRKVSDSQVIETEGVGSEEMLDEPETTAVQETAAQTTEPPETTAATTEATTAPTTEATTAAATEEAALVDGMRPEFKEAMDAYEAFYKEYCGLLKKYTENPTDFSILGQYANMLAKMDEVDKAFQKWDESDLNSEELKYYLDVNNRVLKMLVDVAG